jgi:hypothetical protein
MAEACRGSWAPQRDDNPEEMGRSALHTSVPSPHSSGKANAAGDARRSPLDSWQAGRTVVYRRAAMLPGRPTHGSALMGGHAT